MAIDSPDNGAGGVSGSHDGHADCVPSWGGEIDPSQTDGNRAAAQAMLRRATDGAANAGPHVPEVR